MTNRSTQDKKQATDKPKNLDPFQVWRDWLTQSEQQWNQVLNEAMASDQFGRSSNRLMEVFLTFQRGMNEATQRYFTVLNLPTRTDLLTLGERLTAIEERLAGLESAVRGLAPSSARGASGHSATKKSAAKKPTEKTGARASHVARPRRTKKPPGHGRSD